MPIGLDEFVDRAGRYALDVGLLDHGGERLLRHPARLQESREVAPLPELRNAQFDRARSGLPIASAVAVAVIDPVRAAFATAGAGQALDFQLDQAVRGKPYISRSRSASELFARSVRRPVFACRKAGYGRDRIARPPIGPRAAADRDTERALGR